MSKWTFLTNHAQVLLSIAKHPHQTTRQIGDDVGVTERTAHKIVTDLERDGYITKAKVGRQNAYNINRAVSIKTAHVAVGELLRVLGVAPKDTT